MGRLRSYPRQFIPPLAALLLVAGGIIIPASILFPS